MEEVNLDVKRLQEKLFNKKENGWKRTTEDQKKEIFEYCDKYTKFLNNGKTEREIVAEAKKTADEQGFKDIYEYETLKPGDKIYYINHDKSMYLAVIGEESI